MLTSDHDGPRMSNFPELGPTGLTLIHNSKVEPLSVKDVFEVLRWMRDDLKRIHLAFGHLHVLKTDMEKIKGINSRHSLAYRKYSEQLASLSVVVSTAGENMSKKISEISASTDKINNMEKRLDELDRVMGEFVADISSKVESHGGRLSDISNILIKIQKDIETPWWKKILGGGE